MSIFALLLYINDIFLFDRSASFGKYYKKTIKGKSYYYVVETKRVDGKPRIVSQIYLGKIDDIVRKVTEPPKPQSVKTRQFGITAALMSIVEKLGLIKLIDDIFIKREQGASLGQYMLVAAINRCSDPTSKSKIGEWYEETILPRILGIEPKYLTSQRFWDNMCLITDKNLTEIKTKLAQRVIDTYDIDLSTLLYDATNFFTFIDTNNSCTIPQRGHNKQKRNDLRQISFSLMVSKDGAVPILYDVYQGNENDSVQFDKFIRNLIGEFKSIFTNCDDITIVCDKGNNSKDNLNLILDSSFHLISSLSPTHCKELLDIPLIEYKSCKHQRLVDEKYYHTTYKVLNKDDVTVVCVYNPELYYGQLQGIYNNIRKAQKELNNIRENLQAWLRGEINKGKRPTAKGVELKVKKSISRQYIKDVFKYDVIEIDGFVDMEYCLDNKAFEKLKNTLLGKTILYTDRKDWHPEDIILAYRDQYAIEHAFRQMKDPSWVSWDPNFHWTDQKIKVHAFYCYLSLLLSTLLRRELTNLGLNYSISTALEKLSKIQEVSISYASNRRQQMPDVVVVGDMDSKQNTIYKALDLERFTL